MTGDPARPNDGVSPVPGAAGWQFAAFSHDVDEGMLRIPLVRDDGKAAVFLVPDFVNEGEELGRVALVVIGALERWEALEGLGG